ncbi:MAG: hypothetical protein DRI86_13660 [Bacteroidetes bacterium]|nr:MAG: hypothetical protein DRI86_13660 [Bacteroidota bacterium]
MIRIVLFVFIGFVSIFALQSCNQDSDSTTLSSDLVQNPISADGNTNLDKLPKIKFKSIEHDFGKIIDGVKVAYKFKFTNTGQSDLIISQVKTSCGCTVSRYPKVAIKPGKSDFVELTFDSNRRKGFNHKTATVVANTQPNITTLSIKAMVISADDL